MSDRAVSDSASDKRSVRGVPDAEWDMAIKAAKRAKRPIGEWLCEAIRAYVAAEREDPQVEIIAPLEGSTIDMPAVALTPDQVVTYLHAYREFLKLRGAELPQGGKVMQAADRMMQRAMTEAGMPPPDRIRRIAAS